MFSPTIYPIGGLVDGGSDRCHRSKKSRKPSIYAGLSGVTDFARGVTEGVTFLKTLENPVFMRVSVGGTDGTALFYSIYKI